MSSKQPCLCFQDAMKEYYYNDRKQERENEEQPEADVADVFFELANAPRISYRIVSQNENGREKEQRQEIVIQQDIGACNNHTGGIVWETAYLLLNYLQFLSSSQKLVSCKTFLEVGAGCGLVGLGVHRANMLPGSGGVVLTECAEVLTNLQANLQHNYPTENKKEKRNNYDNLQVCQLDWTQYEQDCQTAKLEPYSMDLIVGTDVVFTTKLVEPLLATLRYLAHTKTQIYLCLQERCKDSHQLLLSKASSHELLVEDISQDVTSISSCSWGQDLECCMLKLTVLPTKNSKVTKKKTKRKRMTSSIVHKEEHLKIIGTTANA